MTTPGSHAWVPHKQVIDVYYQTTQKASRFVFKNISTTHNKILSTLTRNLSHKKFSDTKTNFHLISLGVCRVFITFLASVCDYTYLKFISFYCTHLCCWTCATFRMKINYLQIWSCLLRFRLKLNKKHRKKVDSFYLKRSCGFWCTYTTYKQTNKNVFTHTTQRCNINLPIVARKLSY